MKGKIDENGILHLKRARGWIKQMCPFINTNISRGCGDWCPLFDEILRDSRAAHLTICQNRVLLIATAVIKE